MAIIDPDGLFFGSRLSECSDTAQLYWPRLLLASNGFGRLHVDYGRLLKGPFASLKKPPTWKMVLELVREFHENFLGFAYVCEGDLWLQWDVAPRLLSRYQTAADRRSPAPQEDEYESWREQYRKLKRTRGIDLMDFEVLHTTRADSTISENCGKLPKIAENFSTTRIGVGVGVGIGEGVGKSQKPSARAAQVDPRFREFVDGLDKYWKYKNPTIPFTFGASDGKTLKNLLADLPQLSVDTFLTCLRHRARSDVVQTERPRKWLGNIMDFAGGPIDRFTKPAGSNGNGRQASKADEREQRNRERIFAAFTGQDGGDAPPEQRDHETGMDGAGATVLEGNPDALFPGTD